MERSDKNKPLWRKVTPGSLRPFPKNRRMVYRPGGTVRASLQELNHVIKHFVLEENGKGEFKVDAESLLEKEGKVVVKEEGKKKKTKTKRINKKEPKKTPPKVDEVKDIYEVVTDEDNDGKFNVVSPEGKKMNEDALDAKGAAKLKADLEQETTGE